MTFTPAWPSREEWEARERGTAAWMIETGRSHFEGDCPSFTAEEHAEAATLLPAAVAEIRRACGRVERAARLQSPTAAALRARKTPQITSVDDVAAWLAPIEALEGRDREAWDLLERMRDIRGRLSRTSPMDVAHLEARLGRWPAGYERPSSPDLDRLTELAAGAAERHRERNREEGRRRLAAINAAGAWDVELNRRAKLEDYFRRGPVIRQHTA